MPKDLRLVKKEDDYIAYWKDDRGLPFAFEGARQLVVNTLLDAGWHQRDIADELHMADGLLTPEDVAEARAAVEAGNKGKAPTDS